jgi:hypothetical protein
VVLADAFTMPVSVALSHDGALLAVGTSTRTVWLSRVADETLVTTLQGHAEGVVGVALSADGHLLASGDGEGSVRLWDLPSGQLLAIRQGHAGGARGLALTAHGHLLASGAGDGTVRLWDLPGGRSPATWHGHAGAVWGVALAADGRLLASGASRERCGCGRCRRPVRDRAILGVLIGCGLRCEDAATLTFEHLQQRDGRWVIVDLVGKGRRVRTVPVPGWAKLLIDRWARERSSAQGRCSAGLGRWLAGVRGHARGGGAAGTDVCRRDR